MGLTQALAAVVPAPVMIRVRVALRAWTVARVVLRAWAVVLLASAMVVIQFLTAQSAHLAVAQLP